MIKQNEFFIVWLYHSMSKCRVIGAGASIGRANGGGGFNTGGNQGGGDKKQGLVSTTNMPVELVPYVRTRADGGNSRNWVFCMNQLGGVGRRWGQAAGPGNRGGVHAICKSHAAASRTANPKRSKQSGGYGHPLKHRSNAIVSAGGGGMLGAAAGAAAGCAYDVNTCPYCFSISPTVTDDYCVRNCSNKPPNCPETLCQCSATPPPTYGLVAAFDAVKGDKIWTYKVGKVLSLAVDTLNSVVYVGSDDHYVYALDTVAGNLKWKYLAHGPVPAMTYDYEYTQRLYVCSQSSAASKGCGILDCLDVNSASTQAPTAKWSWTAPKAYDMAGTYPPTALAYLNTAAVVSNDESKSFVAVVAGSMDQAGVQHLGAMYGLDAETGKQTWSSTVIERQGCRQGQTEDNGCVPKTGYNPCAAPAVVQDSSGGWWAATGGQLCQQGQTCGELSVNPCSNAKKCLWDDGDNPPLPPAAITFWKPGGGGAGTVAGSFLRFTSGAIWTGQAATPPCDTLVGCGAVLAPAQDIKSESDPPAVLDTYLSMGIKTSPFQLAAPLTPTSNLTGQAVFAAGERLYAFMLNANDQEVPRIPSLLGGGWGEAASWPGGINKGAGVQVPRVELPPKPQAMTFSSRSPPQEGMLSQYVHVASRTEVWGIAIDTDPNAKGDKVVKVAAPWKYTLPTELQPPLLASVCGQSPETCCGTQPKQVQLLHNAGSSDGLVFVATAAGTVLALDKTGVEAKPAWTQDNFGGGSDTSSALDSVSLALAPGQGSTSLVLWGGPRPPS